MKRMERLRSRDNIWFADLFAGIGGLRIPFDEMGGRCVFTAEIDKFARQTYQANFTEAPGHKFAPAHRWAHDIEQYARHPGLIPEHDVLLAGFPCQPFSGAGVSKRNSLGRSHGFADKTQGTLFYSIARILKHHQPRVFLLENVAGLVKHDKGRTLNTMLDVLIGELGYYVHYKVISASPWLPQKRERIYIVGFRDRAGVKSRTPFSFEQMDVPAYGPTLGSILHHPDEVDPKYTLSEKLWKYLQAYKAKHQEAGNGFGYSLCGPHDVARTLSARYGKDGSEILIAQPWTKHGRPRKLTPRECCRLQGFDVPWQKPFKIPVSDTQAYKQFGNAVPVPVVRAIVDRLPLWKP